MLVRNFVFAVFTIFICAGCASNPTWRQKGVSHYDAQNALAECKYEIGMKNISAAKENQMLTYCMQSKGFRLMQ